MRAAVLLAALAILLTACQRAATVPPPAPAADAGWGFYGGDAGGQRYSPAAQVTPANVAGLKIAWKWSSGDLAAGNRPMDRTAMEVTPILASGRLYVCTPFNVVAALDPATGRQLWRFDPHIDTKVRYPNDFNCRGVAFWKDPAAPPAAPCAERIFTNTNDRRLIALDAATGKACPGFGAAGTVDVGKGVVLSRSGEMQITSPPVVIRGVVVVGSSIDDNQKVDEVSGAVRAYDAVTGAPKWSFDPLQNPALGEQTGAANVWAPMSSDEERGLVFLPTSSPSPDFWGGKRLAGDRYGSSVVAVKAETGEVAWAFATVHHNVWDYDVPAQPTLAMVGYGGQMRPAVIQGTKQGLVFTLDRDTGAPIIPVEERPVPQGGALGDALSPTQPFPVAPKPLARTTIDPKDAWGLFPWDKDSCRRKIAAARHEGLYTPPSTQGTILFPMTGGGINWGGLAYDANAGVMFVNTSNAMHLVTLIPQERFAAVKKANPDVEISPQTGARYGMRREVLVSPTGLPCNPGPWGQLHAVDMKTGKVLWEVTLGTTQDKAPFSQYLVPNIGTPNFGGPIVTGGGLVFIGATLDYYLRAFDARTGKELWRGRLPTGGQATPMTYVWKGRQYVVIAAGGHSKSDTKPGDQIIAFAL